jgi:hypothetical protein
MPPDSIDYFNYLHGEIARARAERDRAMGNLIVDAGAAILELFAVPQSVIDEAGRIGRTDSRELHPADEKE